MTTANNSYNERIKTSRHELSTKIIDLHPDFKAELLDAHGITHGNRSLEEVLASANRMNSIAVAFTAKEYVGSANAEPDIRYLAVGEDTQWYDEDQLDRAIEAAKSDPGDRHGNTSVYRAVEVKRFQTEVETATKEINFNGGE